MRGRGEFILSIYMRTIIYADDSPVDPRRRSSPTDLAWKTYRGSGPTTTSRRRPCSPWCASIVTPANASSRSCAGDWCPTVQSRRRSATPRSTPAPRRRRPSRCFAKRSSAPMPRSGGRFLRVAADQLEDKEAVCLRHAKRQALRICRPLGALESEGASLETFTTSLPIPMGWPSAYPTGCR